MLKAGSSDHFKTDLDAGETFEVPPGFIGAYKGDLDDAANSLHRYLFQHWMPAILRKDAGYPKVEWNAFAATGQGQGSWNPTEAEYFSCIGSYIRLPAGVHDVACRSRAADSGRLALPNSEADDLHVCVGRGGVLPAGWRPRAYGDSSRRSH
jgi:hypothetical protein